MGNEFSFVYRFYVGLVKELFTDALMEDDGSLLYESWNSKCFCSETGALEKCEGSWKCLSEWALSLILFDWSVLRFAKVLSMLRVFIVGLVLLFKRYAIL